jgi:hypothetical protein
MLGIFHAVMKGMRMTALASTRHHATEQTDPEPLRSISPEK